MTDQETEEIEPEYEMTPRPWSWMYALGVAVSTFGNLARVMTVAAESIAVGIARHQVWKEDQRDFVGSVRAGIESLPTVESVR